MAGIDRKSFDHPDETIPLAHGRTDIVRIGDQEVWRSTYTTGWNWDEDFKAFAGGAKSCPLTHREYVQSGRIRYLMDDGTEEIGTPGDYLFIQPGHRAWVDGDETCVLIDW
jgi:hypothetical protein